LWDNGNDFSTTFVEKLVGAHNGEEAIRVHFLSESIEEDGEIMEVIELSGFDRKRDSVDRAFVVNFDRQIASVIISSEFSWLDFPLGICAGLLLCGLPLLFSLVASHGVAAGALTTKDEFINGAGRLGLLMIDNLDSGSLLFWQIILGEISESGMRVLRRVRILPRFIVDIFGLEEHSFQGVFNDNTRGHIVDLTECQFLFFFFHLL